MSKIAISVGDLNGIGVELILLNHKQVGSLCEPVYCVSEGMLGQASERLEIAVPKDMTLSPPPSEDFTICPSEIDPVSGAYSFASFAYAVELAREGEVDSVLTMPIHKKAWELGGVSYKGHTDYLSQLFGKQGIMMLGCEKMFVALFTDHIPLSRVPESIQYDKLRDFMLRFHSSTQADKIAVLGLNPHSGDFGVLGDEEREITKAIASCNETLGSAVFEGAIVPDIAFAPINRAKFTHYIAMYHDQGLAPLKSLYFEESINVTLDMPIVRASVDHGCAFDIAYNSTHPKSSKSYLNAVQYLLAQEPLC